MKDESRNSVHIASRTIYFRVTERGWAIVVMPDNFKVDNYYHGVHIHPDRKQLSIHDPEIIYEIIYQHIIREGKIVEDKIREELGL
ncbi:hypothetical protein [Methanobacterium formicicum]|uniref:Uncharacterized protein n=1 Tax=Methanobacterium formicicum TaxID=2162 RepID=A0A090I466_METFO|nr:hypothetical protein [Methanobacterium formicicum]MDH2658360.1 hypothetical protein [Methanobacterium formicicum]CEA13969.1 hypothetical protein DSM1535_1643 [Methanobacterium formicicum]